MNKSNFVSCVSWIRQGVAKEIPNKCQLTEEQIRSRIENDKQKLKEIQSNIMETDVSVNTNFDRDYDNEDRQIIDRYNLGNYDEEDDDFLISYNTASDPFLDLEQVYSDEEEERDDFRIKPNDNLVLAGHVEENCISLEVKVYNQEDGIYVHHEIYLSSYPLCFQWLDFKNNTEKGNLVAVGDMNDDINIWDLDTIDALDPVATLFGHKKSVLDLSWSKNTPNILASGSADKKCIIWDLQQQTCIKQFNVFNSNVQSVTFHPLETNILLTGDCNGNAKLINYKTGSIKNWKVCQEEIETVIWNPQMPYTFLCTSSTGFLYSLDCRNENSHLFALKAHDEMISDAEFSSSYNGCLMTASADETAKVWSITQNEAKLIQQFEPQVGTILSLAANPDYPFIFAISGNNVAENFKILDIYSFPSVKKHFQ